MVNVTTEEQLRAEVARLKMQLAEVENDLRNALHVDEIDFPIVPPDPIHLLMLQNSKEVFTVTEADGTIRIQSASVKTVLGYEQDELIGKNALSLIHPDDAAFATRDLMQLVSQPTSTVTAEIRFLHKNGSWRDLETTGTNYLHNPALHCLVVSGRDITERKLMEAALRDNEERYRLVAQATHDVIWDWNILDDVQTWTVGIRATFGYSVSYSIAPLNWWTDHLHPEDRDRVLENFNRAVASDTDFWADEYRFQRADETYAYIADRGYILRDDSGKAYRMIGAMTDVTERHQAEQERDRFFTLALDMLCIASFDGYFMRLNPAFETALGWSIGELMAKPFIEWVHPEDRDATLASMEQLRQGIAVTHFENRYLGKDGSYRWLSWTTTPDPETGLIFAAARDTTEDKWIEEQIRALNAELEHHVQDRTAQLVMVNRELDAFSYSVSHDLRAPLRAIDGFSHALLEDFYDNLTSEGRHYLDRIRAATQRMGLLLDDMLKLSRLTRDEFYIEAVDLSAQAREIAAELRETAPEHDVEFIIADGLIVDADARLMRAVMVNLIGNAWKFSSKTSSARIEVGKTVYNEAAAFFVRDNGVGFDMEYSHKMFGAFQRLHGQNEFEGSGIGLAIVARVIHRHSGKVWAEGYVGKGATVYFTV
jgi:PAS domain S-box-containing protein